MESTPLAGGKARAHEDQLLDTSTLVGGRYVHLDVSRVCCVACVVMNVFDTRYAGWNTLFVQNWVLQVLWLVNGICYALSGRNLYQYVCRLSLYFAIGVVVNWAAWLINGWDFWNHYWGVLGQMVFVLWLIVIVLCLAPLKSYLQWLRQGVEPSLDDVPPEEDHVSDPSASSSRQLHGGLVLGLGLASMVALFAAIVRPLAERAAEAVWSHAEDMGAPDLHTYSDSKSFGRGCAFYLQACACSVWILYIFPKYFRDKAYLAWALLANFYLHRLALGYGKADLPFHGFHLVMIAMTAQRLGLRHRRTLGRLVHRYWMVTVFLIALLWPPGLHGDLMSGPPAEVNYARERYVLVEVVLVLVWLTAGPLMVDPKIFTEDRLAWVTEWALLAFLVYRSVAWLFPWPLAWIFLLVLGPTAIILRCER